MNHKSTSLLLSSCSEECNHVSEPSQRGLLELTLGSVGLLGTEYGITGCVDSIPFKVYTVYDVMCDVTIGEEVICTVATGSIASRLRSKLEVSTTFYPVSSGKKIFRICDLRVIPRASGTAHETHLRLRVIQAAERES